MKSLFLSAALLVAFSAQAAPGDTTVFLAHSGTWLSYYNNYDTAVSFPTAGATTYRRIFMEFTLGKYACPGSPTYCGDWDYTVQNFLMTPAGDTVELGRLITPYANSGAPRTPLSWKQRYVFDVTDYAPLLQGASTLRVHYSGYSGGFTTSIRFLFVEGTPARTVLGVQPLWNGAYPYGGTPGIETYVGPRSATAPAGTAQTHLAWIVTGHGADDAGCAEFCPKNYSVLENGAVKETRAIWRPDCGLNHLYPQSGTWVYDRGGWCPGDAVERRIHSLGIAAGSTASVDVDFEAHTSAGGSGASYIVSGAVVYSGPPNKTVDASMEDIIAPSDHEIYFRENPRCGSPVVRIRNEGANLLSSATIEYGVEGSAAKTYNWSGSLATGGGTSVELPYLPSLRGLTGAGHRFTARILSANGAPDADPTNDKLTSTFAATPTWPGAIRIVMRSNNALENSWFLLGPLGDTVARRTPAAPATTYRDTLALPGGGCYRLIVADAGCDGLSWWANPGAGSGSVQVFGTSAIPLPLKGYFGGDFGCGFEQRFSVEGTDLKAGSPAPAPAPSVRAFPNPATKEVTVLVEGVEMPRGTLTLTDAVGRTAWAGEVSGLASTIPVSGLAAGIYLLSFRAEDGGASVATRLQILR